MEEFLLDLFRGFREVYKLFTYFKYRVFNVSDFEKHCYITGMTGSGKSELIKTLVYGLAFNRAPFLFNWDKKSIVIVDPHGDMAEQIAMWEEFSDKKIMQRLVYIDPFLDKNFSIVLNPFDIKDKSDESLDIYAQELTKAFQEIIKESKLSLQMETLLNVCIYTLLRKDNSSLRDLQRFMHDDRNKDLVELGLRSPNPSHREFFKYAFYNSTYNLTKQSIYTKIQSLLNSKIFHNLTIGKSTLDLENLINEGKIIIFNLAKGKLGTDTSEAFGKLVIALLNAIALKRVNLPKSERIPTFLFIDEFQNYISKSIETILAENRKYRFSLILAQQILGQGMTHQTKNIVLSNTYTKFIGMNSTNILKILSIETGIDLEALKQLEKGKFFVKIGNKEPFIFKPFWYLLEYTNSMSAQDWKKVKTYLLLSYYKPMEDFIEARPLPENTENIENIESNTKPKKLKPKLEL